MSWGISPWVYPVWDSLGFLDLGDYFLPHFRDVFNYYLLKYLLMVFLFIFFWDSYDSNVGVFNIVWRSLRLSSFLSFIFLFSCLIYLSLPFYLLLSIFYFTNPIFCLCYSTICCFQSVFNFIYCIIHYILTLFYFF